MDCQICSEKFNKTTRFPIKCTCDQTCCRGCIKKYIETKREHMHCMFCKQNWTREFITDNFEKK
jgi:hypothetical protein